MAWENEPDPERAVDSWAVSWQRHGQGRRPVCHPPPTSQPGWQEAEGMHLSHAPCNRVPRQAQVPMEEAGKERHKGVPESVVSEMKSYPGCLKEGSTRFSKRTQGRFWNWEREL